MTLIIVWNTDVIQNQNKKPKLHEWSLNKFYSNKQKRWKRIPKLLSMNCAGWNPIKLWKYKQYLILLKWKEEIEWNRKIDGGIEALQKFFFERSF